MNDLLTTSLVTKRSSSGVATNHPTGLAVTIRGLRKTYGGKTVLDGIDLSVPSGTVFALLGPNGAGKTTMVQILATLLKPDAGDVTVGGFDLHREANGIRSAIGVTGQFSAVDNLLTGEENLLLMADLHHLERPEGRSRTAQVLDRFDLVEAARRPVATYSGGMRRRLDLAMTLLGDPRIIFLDEPTTGLDPRSRRTMWQIIRDLVVGGVTIFLTTQNLEEADELADFIAVLDRGRIVAAGTPNELKRRIPGGHVQLHFRDVPELDAALARLGDASRDDEALILQIPNDGTPGSLRSLLDQLNQQAVGVERLTVHAPNLDDVFFALTAQSKQEKEFTHHE